MSNLLSEGYYAKLTIAAPAPPPTSILKDPIQGIMPRTYNDLQGRTSDVAGIVANLNWSDLQPTEGGPINYTGASWTNLRNCLATGLPIRMRVFCGDNTPRWLMAKPFASPNISVVSGGSTYIIPRWWDPQFLTAWDTMMAILAQASNADTGGVTLNNHPQIREITSSPASTVYAEPYQRGAGDPGNRQHFVDAGLTGAVFSGVLPIAPDPRDQFALEWSYRRESNGHTKLHNLGWTKVRYYMPFNPLQSWSSANGLQTGLVLNPGHYTEASIDAFAANMGPQGIIGNNSVRPPLFGTGNAYPQVIYAKMLPLGRNYSCQTATLDRIFDPTRAVPDSYTHSYSPPAGWFADHAAGTLPTRPQSLVATISQVLGKTHNTQTINGIHVAVWGAGANDPESLLRNVGTSPELGLLSLELPSGWHNHMDAATCAIFNALFQSIPFVP